MVIWRECEFLYVFGLEDGEFIMISDEWIFVFGFFLVVRFFGFGLKSRVKRFKKGSLKFWIWINIVWYFLVGFMFNSCWMSNNEICRIFVYILFRVEVDFSCVIGYCFCL